MTCSDPACEASRHVNINGIRFDKCRKHYLKAVSELREPTDAR